MLSLLEVVKRSASYLEEKGIERPRREAEEVIADALKLSRLDLYLRHECPLEERELTAIREAIQRRSRGEPTAYIAGQVTFCGLNIQVNRAVLIPRPETEILVEKIAAELSHRDLAGKVLWDVCTGSGCIGLALKRRFPELTVILSDLSEAALEVARKNREAYSELSSVEIRQGNLFAPFSGEKCHFFVANPPYIGEGEILPSSVVDWEPKEALFSGRSGLEFYGRIAEELKHFLYPEGKGWLELGSGQGLKVKEIFEEKGFCSRFEPDWSGHDRFFFIE